VQVLLDSYFSEYRVDEVKIQVVIIFVRYWRELEVLLCHEIDLSLLSLVALSMTINVESDKYHKKHSKGHL